MWERASECKRTSLEDACFCQESNFKYHTENRRPPQHHISHSSSRSPTNGVIIWTCRRFKSPSHAIPSSNSTSHPPSLPSQQVHPRPQSAQHSKAKRSALPSLNYWAILSSSYPASLSSSSQHPHPHPSSRSTTPPHVSQEQRSFQTLAQ
jgi:hypothetical protein